MNRFLFLLLCVFGVAWASSEGMEWRCEGDQCVLVPEESGDAERTEAGQNRRLENFHVAGVLAGYHAPADFLSWLEECQREHTEKTAPSAIVRKNSVEQTSMREEMVSSMPFLERVFRKYGMWLVLILLVPLGISLNLTPCVLPMIPVHLALIGAGSMAENRRGAWLYGGMYGLGMALCYGALGALVAFSGTMFGQWSRSPWLHFAAGAAYLFFALAMGDFVMLDFTAYRRRFQRTTLFTIACMGGLNAVLAGACIAPVLLWVLTMAAKLYAEGEMLVPLLMPLALGIGLGAPWPFLSAGVALLPSPGKWMVSLKRGLAVLIAIAAIREVAAGGRILWRKHTELPGWETQWEAALTRAWKAERMVLVEFSGAGCEACQKMKRKTLPEPSVRQRLEKIEKVTVDAGKRENAGLLRQWDIKGIPTYILLVPILPAY